MAKRRANERRADAERYQKTREAHHTETAEDYVEIIAELIEENGEARVVALARRLGVSHVTVNRAIGRLRKSGLVTAEPYQSIKLTKTGQALAKSCKSRHEIVVKFLRALGVPADIADIDAEGIEHHVSKQTLNAFSRFIKSSSAPKSYG